jgi:uncharacterized protein YjbI with pentapeptide repeats
MRDVIDLYKFKQKLLSVKLHQGMSSEEIGQALVSMKNIIKAKLLEDNIPTTKTKFILKYIEVWRNRSLIKLMLKNNIPLALVDLSGVDLASFDLVGVDMAGVNLKGANLTRANLARADLKGANLMGANLSGANLLGANLEEANLVGANLEEAYLAIANLSGADLEGAKLERTDLKEANLKEANLAMANLRRAVLPRSDLKGADLRGAILIWADLRAAKLEGADLRGSKLEGADLRVANFKGAYLEGANLKGAILAVANMEGVNLEGINLSGADLTWANLKEAKLAGAITLKSMGLTPEQKAKTIRTPEELLIYTNVILEQTAENISKDIVSSLPDLYKACFKIIPRQAALNTAAKNLKEKFPYFCNVEENLKLTKDALSKGGLDDKKKSNYFALTTLAQGKRTAVNDSSASISSLPAELVSEIGKFLLTDILPEKNAYNLADFMTNQVIPNPREAALETFASKAEKSICQTRGIGL